GGCAGAGAGWRRAHVDAGGAGALAIRGAAAASRQRQRLRCRVRPRTARAAATGRRLWPASGAGDAAAPPPRSTRGTGARSAHPAVALRRGGGTGTRRACRRQRGPLHRLAVTGGRVLAGGGAGALRRTGGLAAADHAAAARRADALGGDEPALVRGAGDGARTLDGARRRRLAGHQFAAHAGVAGLGRQAPLPGHAGTAVARARGRRPPLSRLPRARGPDRGDAGFEQPAERSRSHRRAGAGARANAAARQAGAAVRGTVATRQPALARRELRAVAAAALARTAAGGGGGAAVAR